MNGYFRNFKKIIVTTLILILLSNYLSIVFDFSKVMANEISKINTNEINNYSDNATNNNENKEENTMFSDFTVVNVKNVELNKDKNTSDENATNEDVPNENISEENISNEISMKENQDEILEEYKDDLNNVEISSKLFVDNLIKFDNADGKGIYLENTLEIDINNNDTFISNIAIDFFGPKLNDVNPKNIEFINVPSNVTLNYDSNTFTGEIIKNDVSNEKIIIKFKTIYDNTINDIQKYSMNGNVKISDDKNIEIREINVEINDLKETLANFSNYSSSSNNSSIYKGYLFANSNTELDYDFKYSTIQKVSVSKSKNLESIIIDNTTDYFMTKDNSQVDFTSFYKKISISKADLESILGNEGYIVLYSNNNEKIGRIDKNSTIEDSYYVYNFDNNQSNIKLKIVNPLKNGDIKIITDKVVSYLNKYTNEQINSFSKIISKYTGKTIYSVNDENVVLQSVDFQNELLLEDTESNISLNLNNNSLSSTKENKLQMTIDLNTNSEKYEIFKNPVIEIKFPASVEDIFIDNMYLLYKNGLSIGKSDCTINDQDEKVLRIELNGTQKEYNPGMLLNGTKLFVNLTVNLDPLVANSNSILKLTYSNENSLNLDYLKEKKEYKEISIRYNAIDGLIKSSKINSINSKLENVQNINDETNIGELDLDSDTKTVSMSMDVVNNYEEEIKNVVIVGKIPNIGVTNSENVDLGNTLDTTIKENVAISGSNAKIYYSTEINPNKDDNVWQEQIEDKSKIKSYKIVLNSNEMKNKETINFKYDLIVPGNLSYNQKIFGIYTVYYNLNGENVFEDSIVGAQTEEKEIEIENCQTSVVSKEGLAIGIQTTAYGDELKENDSIYNGQILKYNVLLKNTSNKVMNNIKIQGSALNGNLYYQSTFKTISSTTDSEIDAVKWLEDTDNSFKTENIDVGTINPGEYKIVSFQVVPRNVGEDVSGVVNVSADDSININLESSKNKIIDSKLELKVESAYAENVSNLNLESNSDIVTKIIVKNNSDALLNNIPVNIIIPKNMGVNSELTRFYGVDTSNYSYATYNLSEFIVDSLEPNETKAFNIGMKIEDLDYSLLYGNIWIKAYSTINDEKYCSNYYNRTIIQSRSAFDVEFKGSLEDGSIVRHDDKIYYDIKATNIGVLDARFDIMDIIPKGLDVTSIVITKPDGTTEEKQLENGAFVDKSVAKPGESISYRINATVNLYHTTDSQTNIVNALIINSYITKELLPINYIIEYPDGFFDEQTKNDEEVVEEEEHDYEEEEKHKDDDKPSNPTEDNEIEEPNDGNLTYDEDDSLVNNDNTDSSVKDEDNDSTKDDVIEDENKNTNIEDNDSDDQVNNSSNNNFINNFVGPTNNYNNIIENKKETFENENNVNKYSISGKAWFDSNKDGIDDNEEILSGIKILLYKSDSQNYSVTTQTNINGEYYFKDIEEGKYVLVASFDNNQYVLTDYKVNSNNSSKISNFKDIRMTVDGDEKIYGISDVIELNKNVENLNVGFIDADKVDFEISSTIISANIINNSNAENVKFDEESDLQKIEIAAKKIKDTKVNIKYKIKISNKGNVSGYINQISNEMPEGFEFDPSINKNWSIGEDGKIYNSSMQKELLLPNESITYTLVLSVDMNKTSTGNYKNILKIESYTNEEKINDINENNNNTSNEIILTIKTGPVKIITLIITIISGILLFILCFEKIIKNLSSIKHKTFKNKINDGKIIKNKVFKNKVFENKVLENKKMAILILAVIFIFGLTTYVFSESCTGMYALYNITQSIDTYFNATITIGDLAGTVSASDFETYTKSLGMQCIEPVSELTTAYGNAQRAVLGDIKFGYSANNQIKAEYKMYGAFMGDGYATDEARSIVQFFGHVGEYINSGNNQYKTFFVRAVKYSQPNTDAWLTWTNNYSINRDGASEANDTQELANADGWDNFFEVNKNRLVVAKITTSPVSDEDGNYIGPFRCTFPSGSDADNSNSITVDGVNYSSKLYTKAGSTYSSTSLNNVADGTSFYIKYSADNTENEKVTVKLTNSHSYYKGRITLMASNGDGQMQSFARAKKVNYTGNAEWTVEVESFGVSINKYLYSINGTADANKVSARGSLTQAQKDSSLVHAELGDTIYYKINVKNTGKTKFTYVEFEDTFENTYLQFSQIKNPGSSYSWNESVSGNWKASKIKDGKYKISYSGDVAKDSTVSLYIKFTIKDKLSDNTINTRNTATIKVVQKGTSNKTNKLKNSTLVSSDIVGTKDYNASINLYITGITGQTIATRQTSKSTSLYAEPGDTVTFKLEIKNTSANNTAGLENYGSIKNIEINDTWTNNTYLSAKTYSTDNSTYDKNPPTNWTKTSNGYKYSATISNSNTAILYIRCTVNSLSKTDIEIKDTVSFKTILNRNSKEIYSSTTNKMKNITSESSDKFKYKMYSAVIEDTIYSLAGNTISSRDKNTKLYAEPGDEVIFKINVKNTGTSSTTYGKFKKIEFTNTWINSNYISEIQYSATTSGFSNSLPTNWSMTGTTIIYSSDINAANEATLYIKCKVKKAKTNIEVTNTSTITKIVNKNSVTEYGTSIDGMKSITTSSLDKFTIKKYTVLVQKSVDLITDKNGNALASKSECELGDTVKFKITVKNSGTDNNLDGKLYSINLNDYYDAKRFKFVKIEGTGWTQETATTDASVTNTNVPLKYTDSNGLAPGSTATVYVYLKIDTTPENLRNDVSITNTAEIKTNDQVTNKNNIDIRDVLNGTFKDSASVNVLSYHIEISKYISNHNNVAVSGRDSKTNTEKYNAPVEVEKNDTVVYTLKIKNTKTSKVKDIVVKDNLEAGLEFINSTKAVVSAKKYSPANTAGSDIKVEESNSISSSKTFTTSEVLDFNEYILINVKCKVTMSNMYLYNLENNFEITSAKNRNDIQLLTYLNYDQNENKDYVRLKNLIISGYVWEDSNRDGVMGSDESKLSNIIVNLVDSTNKKYTTTTTDNNGKYTFVSTNGKKISDNSDVKDQAMVLSENRVVKATNRNETTGNYDSSSKYIDYYIEFEYNGVMYKSATNYSGYNNILLADCTYNNNYLTDSNAIEFTDQRTAFKNKLETIYYNTAMDKSNNLTALEYTKNGHESKLNDTNNTMMKAYSFVSNNSKGPMSNSNAKYLWFNTTGETEYLKYINLGLETQKVDLSIKQEVEEVNTLINGYEMKYDSLGYTNEMKGDYVSGGEKNPFNLPFKIYGSDYYYNHDQYSNEEVKKYKDNTELKLNVTYKVTVTNNNVNDNRDVYAVINEITDYYSNNFIKYNPANNTRSIKLNKSDAEVVLVDGSEVITEAWYDKDGKEVGLTLSNDKKYGNIKDLDNYNNLYVTGFDGFKLKEGQSFDYYIKFSLDVYNSTAAKELANKLKIGNEYNIVEINAYSTYEKNNTPAGYIDIDSNPGNLSDASRLDLYEDDTYRTGINIYADPSSTTTNIEKERQVSGIIWDDTRSEDVGGQYLGNGINTIKTKKDVKNKNAISNSNKDEKNDTVVEGAGAKLEEIIAIPQKDGGYHYYSETISPYSKSKMTVRSNEKGEYVLESFIPGIYKTVFTYGDKNDANMLIHNGQDYKSTAYYTDLDKYIYNTSNANAFPYDIAASDTLLGLLETEGKSDARDDEIRRLEVNSYSETLNNEKIEILQQINTSNNAKNTLIDKTNMNAETVAYCIRPEKVAYTVKNSKYEELKLSDVRYGINNIDFGIEYRPMVSIELKKYISEIKVKLNTDEEIVDIKFDNIYEDDDTSKEIIGTKVDETSKGFDKLQYVPTVDNVEGLAYLNIDSELLQGCSIEVKYVFAVNNKGEIDRVGNLLNDIRYKDNAATSKYKVQYVDNSYSFSKTAAESLKSEYYGKYLNSANKEEVYMTKLKKATKDNDEYYGKFNGQIYYTGSLGKNDIVSDIKINKILDFVDNDFTFIATNNNSENRYWSSYTANDLKDKGLIDKESIKVVGNIDGKVNSYDINTAYDLSNVSFAILDSKNSSFDKKNGKDSNLAVTVDDRTKDQDEYQGGETDLTINKSLSKFLEPKININNGTYKNNEGYTGSIYIVTNKVSSAETNSDDLTFENIAEIIEYTTLTGRITPLISTDITIGSTIGNVNINQSKHLYESDTDRSEVITLAPPTGEFWFNYYTKIFKTPIIVVTSALLGVVITLVMDRKIRLLKNKKRKKFYK